MAEPVIEQYHLSTRTNILGHSSSYIPAPSFTITPPGESSASASSVMASAQYHQKDEHLTASSSVTQVQPDLESNRSSVLTMRADSSDDHTKQKRKLKEPTLRDSLMSIVTYNWANLLLVFIPIGWAMHFTHQKDAVVFVLNLIALIPLASLLGFATEDLSVRIGPVFGGLLNATFGNTVEILVGIFALLKDDLRVVQASMLGSFLSNALLVTGMCFFLAGIRHFELAWGDRIASFQAGLIILAGVAIIIPAGFASSLTGLEERAILIVGRGAALLMFLSYTGCILFQLNSHGYLFDAEAAKKNEANVYGDHKPPKRDWVFILNPKASAKAAEHAEESNDPLIRKQRHEGEEEEEEPQMLWPVALLLLTVVTALSAFTAEIVVDGIDGMTEHLSKEFVAVILLPIAGNAVEHWTALKVSWEGKITLALSVAIGSAVQILLGVYPIMVIIAWGLGKPLQLNFNGFENVLLGVAVIAVSSALSDGRTHWLEGYTLITIYAIMTLATIVYPN